MSRLPFLLLGLLASALSAVILLDLDPAGKMEANLPQAAPRRVALAPSPTPGGGGPGRTAEWAATVLARPLFNPDRRPLAPGSAAAPAASTALPRLTGTLVTSAGRSAIFASSPAPLVVQEGGRVGGYTVMRIEPGQVLVTGPGGARTVNPGFDPNRPAAPVAARPPLPAAGALAGSVAGQGPPGLGTPGALPSSPGPPIPGQSASPLLGGPSPGAPGTAEEAVPFEQNATPSGMDILRNMNRNAPSAAAGGSR
jgi:general secretion pathway protein N